MTQQFSPYSVPPPVTSVSIPPAPPRRPKKSNLGLVLGLGAAGLLVVGGGAAAGGYWYVHRSTTTVALPFDAHKLPAQTQGVGTEVLAASREANPEVRRAYLAADFARVCSDRVSNPASELESVAALGPQAAKTFFKKKHLADVKSALECGDTLASALKRPTLTNLTFNEEDVPQHALVVQSEVTELPARYGFIRHEFSGLSGHCQPQVDEKGAPRDCVPTDRGAFHDGQTWFFGSINSLEPLARAVVRPQVELNATASALADAAAATAGYADVVMGQKSIGARDVFRAPCSWARGHNLGGDRFMESCFPKSVDKLIEHLDGRLRAVAFETDDDVASAGAVHGNIVLVARDAEAAGAVERDAKEIVDEWKSHIANNEGKIIKQSTEAAVTARQKKWAAVADTFVRAMGKLEVKRTGRVVRVSYADVLAADDKRELADADATTLDRRLAVADVLGSIQRGTAINEVPLAKLVGKSWATYLVHAPQLEESVAKGTYPESECRSTKARLTSINVAALPTREAKTLYFEHQFTDCKKSTPNISPLQRGCLMTFKTPVEFAKCVPTFAAVGTVEPPEVEFGDKKK